MTTFTAPFATTDYTIDADETATLMDTYAQAIDPAPDDDPLSPVDLHAVGYKKAEQHRGNAHALENLLNRVLRGYLVDERNDDTRRQQQQTRIDQQIQSLEKQAEEARTKVRKINEMELPAIQESIDQLDDEMLQIRKDEAAGLRNPDHRDRMQLKLYGGLTSLLTLFVFLFYVSAFYSAFYRDVAGEMQVAGPDGQASVLAAIFAKKAFFTFDFHWFGPLLLFAFGGFLHVLSENRTTVGRVLLVTMVTVILLTDGLIAYFIEDKNYQIKVLMGLAKADEHQWWTSPVFYLVIAMGFVAALVWSGLLHAVMHEVGKKDVARLTALDIRYRQDKQQVLVDQMNTLKGELVELEGQIGQIEIDIKALQASRQSVVFSPSELEKYVTDFYDGWLTYVNNRMGNDASLRDTCDQVLKAFYAQHLTA